MVLLSDLSRQLDPQQTVGQGVDEDDEADVVGGGHEVAEGEGLRVLDTLEPGHHHALLARPATRLELRNSLGMTAALHLGPAAARAVSVLRLLTRHGAQLHAEDDSGRSVLAWAAKKPGLGRVVSFLVEEAGCEVTARVMAEARPEHRALLGDRLGCPRSLKVHARNAIWRMVRNASSGDPESHLSYVIKMETLTSEGTMPRSLRHYLAMN